MKMKMKKNDAGNENQNEKKIEKKYFQLFQSLASRASHNDRCVFIAVRGSEAVRNAKAVRIPAHFFLEEGMIQ